MSLSVMRYNYPQQFGPSFDRLIGEIGEQIREGRYILTADVTQFEKLFAKYLSIDEVVGLNSGTDALIIGMMALGIGAGDEVITQANTFYATVAAICFVGAKPVLVDADPSTFLMDVSQVKAVITRNTRAILPVHMYGACTPMDGIMRLADQYRLNVLEDAAQSHGASFRGQRAGTFGDVGCFSFHPSKNLAAAGDAGACSTRNGDLATRMRIIRGLGQRTQNEHVALGLNSKLDAIQAKVLSWKLPLLDAWNEARAKVADLYKEQLADLPVSFQETPEESTHVYHLFQVKTDHRDALLKHLTEAGIDAVIRYPQPVHCQKAFSSQNWKPGQFPVAEDLAANTLCLPIRPDMVEDETQAVVRSIRQFFGA